MPIFQADLPMFGFYVGGKIIVVNKIGYLEPHHVMPMFDGSFNVSIANALSPTRGLGIFALIGH